MGLGFEGLDEVEVQVGGGAARGLRTVLKAV